VQEQGQLLSVGVDGALLLDVCASRSRSTPPSSSFWLL
jgi:hypothetical protein